MIPSKWRLPVNSIIIKGFKNVYGITSANLIEVTNNWITSEQPATPEEPVRKEEDGDVVTAIDSIGKVREPLPNTGMDDSDDDAAAAPVTAADGTDAVDTPVDPVTPPAADGTAAVDIYANMPGLELTSVAPDTDGDVAPADNPNAANPNAADATVGDVASDDEEQEDICPFVEDAGGVSAPGHAEKKSRYIETMSKYITDVKNSCDYNTKKANLQKLKDKDPDNRVLQNLSQDKKAVIDSTNKALRLLFDGKKLTPLGGGKKKNGSKKKKKSKKKGRKTKRKMYTKKKKGNSKKHKKKSKVKRNTRRK